MIYRVFSINSFRSWCLVSFQMQERAHMV